ncbi:type II secretion system protein GspL [Rhodoferax sp.]|uniref:type II secretion system protein GspL n=1 Tax=Rhodoferax sp. TaxID=50421 RepID=UPI002608DDFA|nr:type II secretion system protein GspL [Rhodoferax sp.]MDD2919013.1 type II secretion system protein GspL [Rhodoferax sp.]
MTSLIIALPNASADASAQYDYVLTADGSAPASYASVPLALLPLPTERQTEVVVLLPMSALSWHQVQLPKGSLARGLMAERGASRLRAILEGLLEERLLDDPAQLHLALQPQPVAEAPIWVAACDKTWLGAHLQALAQAGLAAHRIVPEFTPEALAHTLYVLGDEQHPMLLGANLVLCPLSAAAVAWLGDAPAQADLPEVVAEPAAAALAESLFKRPVALQPRPQRLLQAAQTPWDLAQFELVNANRDRAWARLAQGSKNLLRSPQWRAARLALVALVLVNFVALNAWAWREQAALQAKRQAVRAVLTQTFPKIPVVVDAPLQMAREVAVLQRASGAASEADLEAMLSILAAVLPATQTFTAIDYTAQELRATAPAVDDTEQARVALALRQQGLAAAWEGAQWAVRAEATP